MTLIPTSDSWNSPYLKGLDAEKPTEWGSSASIAFFYATDTNALYVATRPASGAPVWNNVAAGAGVAWGGITGTLANQTDLAAALAAKVPATRTVNAKALSGDITLSAADVSAVPTTRTVNAKALSADVTLSAADVSAVPTSRTVNTRALSADITLTAADVAALALAPRTAWTPQLNFGGGHVGMTGTSVGWYSQVGPILFYYFDIQLSAKGSSTGAPTITGLPTASVNQANLLPTFPVTWQGMTSTLVNMISTMNNNDTKVTLNAAKVAATGNTGALADTDFANATVLQGAGWYWTA